MTRWKDNIRKRRKVNGTEKYNNNFSFIKENWQQSCKGELTFSLDLIIWLTSLSFSMSKLFLRSMAVMSKCWRTSRKSLKTSRVSACGVYCTVTLKTYFSLIQIHCLVGFNLLILFKWLSPIQFNGGQHFLSSKLFIKI